MLFNAGNIQLHYKNGTIRYLSIGNAELIQMIYVALRDEHWGTYKPVVISESVQRKANCFKINCVIHYVKDGAVFFKWNIVVTGNENSVVEYKAEGTALQQTITNRAGICVLHPIEGLQGGAVIVTDANGAKENFVFPQLISPHQPFTNIAAMQWQAGGNTCNLVFSGEVFETEDHRNWGDANYKTYCRPLHLPFPYIIKEKEVVRQSVTFTAIELNDYQNTAKVLPCAVKNNYFQLGIAASTQTPPNDSVTKNIKALHLDFYSIELNMATGDWKIALANHFNTAQLLRLKLFIAAILPEKFENSLNELVNILKMEVTDVCQLLLLNESSLVTAQALIDAIPAVKRELSNILVGAGTRYNFCELNRNRRAMELADFVSFGYQPQEHDTNETTIMVNAACLQYMVQSAEALYQKPVCITPVTFTKRFNPYATNVDKRVIAETEQYDQRLHEKLGRDWTEACINTLLGTAVCAVSFFSTHGIIGVVDELGNHYPVHEAMKNYTNLKKLTALGNGSV